MCRSHDRCHGRESDQKYIAILYIIIHPVRQVDFMYVFGRKNVEVSKFSPPFHFFCKFGEDHHYLVSWQDTSGWWNTTVPQVLIYTVTLLCERRKKFGHVLLLLVFCDKCAELKFCHVSCCN
jgi:hypothetical protein